MPRIAALLTYPVDWGRAVRVKSAAVGPLGIEGDRRYRITDEAGLELKGAALSQLFIELRGAELVVSAAGQERLALPSPAADGWFSMLLKTSARCVARGDEAATVLATTTASLAHLNQQLPEAVGIERFAPSLILEGTDPFEEDSWHAVSVGGARFKVVPAQPPRLPFGVELRLEGTSPVTLRPGQSLDVERYTTKR